MSYYVYIIRSQIDFRDYVGITNNLERRIEEHNRGSSKSTKGFRPWKLIHFESVDSRESARAREKYLKSGYGKMWIKRKYPK